MFLKILDNLFICDSDARNDLSKDFFHSFSFVLDFAYDSFDSTHKIQEKELCGSPLIWNIHPPPPPPHHHPIAHDNKVDIHTSRLYKCLGSIVLRMHFELTRSNLVLIFIGSCLSMYSYAMTIIIAYLMYRYNIGVLKAIKKLDEYEGLTTNISKWENMIPSLLLFERDILLKNNG